MHISAIREREGGRKGEGGGREREGGGREREGGGREREGGGGRERKGGGREREEGREGEGERGSGREGGGSQGGGRGCMATLTPFTSLYTPQTLHRSTTNVFLIHVLNEFFRVGIFGEMRFLVVGKAIENSSLYILPLCQFSVYVLPNILADLHVW